MTVYGHSLLRIVLVIIAVVLALLVLVGASLGSLDTEKALAIAVLLLAAALVV